MLKHRIILVVLFGFFLGGCGGSPVESTAEAEDLDVAVALVEAIQDEYRAELIYLEVVEDLGQVRPFSNILYAEVRHSEALARLFQARGWEVPAPRWNASEIPSFPSLTQACRAGVQAEIENAEIYDEYLASDLPSDVLRVFSSNRAASLNNHLPAFQRCS